MDKIAKVLRELIALTSPICENGYGPEIDAAYERARTALDQPGESERIRAEERERCARICDMIAEANEKRLNDDSLSDNTHYLLSDKAESAHECARAIRSGAGEG
jgi:hypothetical protein